MIPRKTSEDAAEAYSNQSLKTKKERDETRDH
jgi:hypothetical protein